MEELSEMIVQKQLGYNKKPIIILNTNGFYDKLKELLDEYEEKGMLDRKARDLALFVDSVEEFEALL